MSLHIHDVGSHLTVLLFQSITFSSLARPVQRSQLFQAELLSTGVYLVLAVHRPLISRLTVAVNEHRHCRLCTPGVPMCPANLTGNTARCIIQYIELISINRVLTRSSAIAEGPHAALVSRNPATTKHLI